RENHHQKPLPSSGASPTWKGMKLNVKTLQGKQFPIEVSATDKISDVKVIIQAANADFEASRQKLIHTGKVLKDDVVVEAAGIKENDFLVCMVTKPKPAAAPAPASAAAAAPAAAATPVASTAAAPATPAPAAAAAAATTTPAASGGAAPTPSAPSQPEIDPEAVTRLTEMGFPADQARQALRAANNNPDMAAELLMSGVTDFPPAGELDAVAAPPAAVAASPVASAGTGLEALRALPQFDNLRRMVQANPQSLQLVLQQIGQQNQGLLQTIHANQQAFIQMMNEPVAPAPAEPAGGMRGMGGMGGDMGLGGMGDAGAANPAQLAQLLSSLPEGQRAHVAAQMGLSPEQLTQVTQMLGSMPPEQLQQMLGMMQGGGMPGMSPGGAGGGAVRVNLTEEEAAAVGRLEELGFDRRMAVQAYLACDKDEALAANLLMDGMG
ncbi:unnamed protein product, partial [Chrysoparadoxa australica]